MIDRLRLAIDALLHGAPAPIAPASGSWEMPESPFANPEHEETRREAAMSLMDDELHGFVLLRIVRSTDEPGEVMLSAVVPEELHVVMVVALSRLAHALTDA